MSSTNLAQNKSNDFTVSILEVINQHDQVKSDILAKNQKLLFDLKREISISSKKNFTLERDIKNLDKKIALLIKNRITLEEILQSGDIIDLQSKTTTIKDKSQRDYYGQLFYLLQNNTTYIAQLAKLAKVSEIDNLLQTVMFTLYGNQYEEKEEHLLLSMFQKVLIEEFKDATAIGSLLRANTALTRMMTTYTRRGPGQQYLKQALIKPLQNITNEKDLNLEVNPSTVYESYINEYETKTGKPSPLKRKVSPEECAQNENVKEIIAPRIEKLIFIGDQFLDSIIGTLDSVPYGIRFICRQIKELVQKKFPNATRAQTCGLIGGFFLLRYINPAVVTPTAFMLVDNVHTSSKRNLTFTTKMLQNLANNVNFGGVKEFFMEPLNAFIEKNRDRLNDFLEKLTLVENLDENSSLDKYLALGKSGDTHINITLNEMYFVHSLVEQHLNVLAPDSNDPLRQILSDLGPAPAQLSRADNANVELKLFNRFSISNSESELANSLNPEQAYNDTKILFFSLLRLLAVIRSSSNVEMGTSMTDLAKFASATKNQEMTDILKKVVVGVKTIQTVQQGDGESLINRLKKEIMNELYNYESYIAKTNLDLEKLKQVLSAIQEHNVFLQQQLDYYEKYLSNVRESCGSSVDPKKKPKDSKDSKKDSKDSKSKDSKKDSKDSKKDKSAKKGPFKFSYSQLEKDGIITESEVPNDRRSNIYFHFTSDTPGTYDVCLIYRTVQVSDIKLHLDELLEMQSNGQTEYETDYFKLNVNLLLYLLNKTFISN